MTTPSKSYAEALAPRVRPGTNLSSIGQTSPTRVLGFDDDPDAHRAFVLQTQSMAPSALGGASSIPPPPPPPPRAPPLSRSVSNYSPRSTSPSMAPRRPSLAQVLSKVTSRHSLLSPEEPSGAKISSDNVTSLQQVERVTATKSKKSRSKNRRRKASRLPHYGDNNSSNGYGSDNKPRNLEDTTDLLTAIANEDVATVKSIIDRSTKSRLDESTLPQAALNGNFEIVTLLLDCGKFDINARDPDERTALYAATSRGHETVAILLRQRGAKQLSREESKIAIREKERWREFEAQIKLHGELPPIEQAAEYADLTAEPESQLDQNESQHPQLRTPPSRGESEDGDHISRLEIGSLESIRKMEEVINKRRREVQKKGEWVAGPIKNQELQTTPPKERKIQSQLPKYPGFGFEIPVVEIDFAVNGGHRVEKTVTVDQLLYGSESPTRLGTSTSPATCRWYHIPANHLGWAEDLIMKIYENRPLNEKKKRDIILAREPFYKGEYDRANTTMLDPRPQARSLKPIFRNMTLDRAGNMKLSRALTMHMPYVHWETEENRAEMAHVMKEVRQARKYDIESGDRAQRLIPDLGTIAKKTSWSKNEKMLCAYLYNKPAVHPRRTLDQFYYHMLEDTEQRDQDQVITRYYHKIWKQNHSLPEDDEEADFAMENNPQRHQFSLKCRNEEAYTPQENPSLSRLYQHSSQDQLSVEANKQSENLSEAEEADRRKHEEKHVLMVDQLWLWILDENTIISSFPQNWSHDTSDHQRKDESDPLDVFQSILEYLTRVNRSPLESVHDLSQLIVSKCLSTFCKRSTPYGPMQILDVYESAIASVTDKESKIFAKFATKSKNSRNDTPDSRESPEDLYNIDEEIEQLKEIKDIQDELHILSVLLDSQKQVLEQAAIAFKSTTDIKSIPESSEGKSPINTPNLKFGQSDTGEVAPYSSENNFSKLQQMVIEQEKRRKALEVQAEAANKALNHLLDLKQKQANVSEARSARWTAESTKQQGNVMVLFTLVTIIFAPLSLMAALFSLRVVEFPANLHLNYVLKYMFVVSIAIIAPLIGLVIYTTRGTITHLVLRLETQLLKSKRKDGLSGKHWIAKQQDHDGDTSSSTTEATSRNVGGLRRRLVFWKKRNKGGGAEDTEKAAATDTSGDLG